jgi:hypothetical protein
MSWHDAWVALFGVCVGLLFHFWKSYWGARGKKAAEIDAVQAKMDLVISQLKLTTNVSEGIRAEFLEKGSAKQRLREMRKEVSFKAVDIIAELQAIVVEALDEGEVQSALMKASVYGGPSARREKIMGEYEHILTALTQMNARVGLVFESPAPQFFEKVMIDAGAVIGATNAFQYKKETADRVHALFLEHADELFVAIREQMLE